LILVIQVNFLLLICVIQVNFLLLICVIQVNFLLLIISPKMRNCFPRPSMSQAGSGSSSSVRQCVTSEDDLKWRICLHPPSTQQIFTVAAQKEKMQFRIILTQRGLEDVVCARRHHCLTVFFFSQCEWKTFFFDKNFEEKRRSNYTSSRIYCSAEIRQEKCETENWRFEMTLFLNGDTL
jgi:hypothetical protein